MKRNSGNSEVSSNMKLEAINHKTHSQFQKGSKRSSRLMSTEGNANGKDVVMMLGKEDVEDLERKILGF